MINYNDDDVLDTLLFRHHVSLSAVYDCAAEKLVELNDMEHIFDLETAEHAKLLITIPMLLFATREAETIITCFREEESGNMLLMGIEPEPEKYKVLLLSAFVYNPSFFSMAWNWCAYIQDKVQKAQVKTVPRLVKNEAAISGSTNRVNVFNFPQPLQKYRMVAASSGNHSFGEATHLEGIGELRQFVEEIEGRYHFQFVLTITNEQLFRPFALEVDCTSVKDGKTYHIRIEDDPDNPKRSLRSICVEDADVSQGIAIHRIEFQPGNRDE